MMKSDSKSQSEALGAVAVDAVADPFAGDLFAGSRTSGAVPALESPLAIAESPDAVPSSDATAPESLWHAALPKVSVSEARLSATLAAVPPSLSQQAKEALAHAITHYTRLMGGEVTLDLISLYEVNLAETIAELDVTVSAPRVSLTFIIEPERAPAALSLDASFAAAVVDRLLGGTGAMPDALRPLSVTEQAVFEFLCLSVLRELNRSAGEPLLRLGVCESGPPSRLLSHREKTAPARSAEEAPSKDNARGERGINIMLRVGLGNNVGLVSLLLSDTALAALSVTESPLLARIESRREGVRARLARFKEFAPDVALRLLLGETQLDAHDLAGLEGGDVVLIERPLIDWRAGHMTGFLRVGVGDGDGFLLAGNVAAKKQNAKKNFEKDESPRPADAGTLALKIESISGGDGRRAEAGRIDVEDERNLDIDAAENAAALGGLLLTVHIELAACRISLDELSRLRAGQIIELGCRPTDPVHLVTEGRRVATGELIDIEGRLGVRVKHLVG